MEILTAKSGEEGLRHIKRGQIDLIITDFKMPGMDGLQFLDYAAPLVPKARAIMISAFRAPALVGRQAPLPVVAFMEKPFDVARLVETVNQHLAAPA